MRQDTRYRKDIDEMLTAVLSDLQSAVIDPVPDRPKAATGIVLGSGHHDTYTKVGMGCIGKKNLDIALLGTD